MAGPKTFCGNRARTASHQSKRHCISVIAHRYDGGFSHRMPLEAAFQLWQQPVKIASFWGAAVRRSPDIFARGVENMETGSGGYGLDPLLWQQGARAALEPLQRNAARRLGPGRIGQASRGHTLTPLPVKPRGRNIAERILRWFRKRDVARCKSDDFALFPHGPNLYQDRGELYRESCRGSLPF